MKIVQLNIWMGQLLHPALAFIDREAPDIVCAQEVLSAQNGTGLFGLYQTHERLSERFPYCFYTPTYSFNALGEVCKYGNAIYSKHPLSDMRVEFTSGSYQDDMTINGLKEHDQIRNIQICKVSPSHEKDFYIANHHGYHVPDSRGDGDSHSEASMRKVASALKKLKGPLAFCDDLNVNPKSKTIHELDALLLRNLTVEYDLTSTLSEVHRLNHDLLVDYIFLSMDFKPKTFKASGEIVSDHKPLILEIES